MLSEMNEAEILFNQVFTRWLNREGFIRSFRRVSYEGMTEATKAIEASNADFVKEMTGGDHDDMFVNKKLFFEANPPEQLVHQLTEQTVSQAQIAVDAASIVFAHCVLDAAALDYCRVTALVAPRDWESVVDQRQIKLTEVRESNYEQILKQKLDEFFEQLERESLLKKVGYLFARCKPPEKWSPMHDYVFDLGRLEKLDAYRHQIIHGNGPIQGIPSAEEEVDYLMRMVLFFQGLVNLRYKLKLNPFYAFTGIELPAQTPTATTATTETEKKEPS